MVLRHAAKLILHFHRLLHQITFDCSGQTGGSSIPKSNTPEAEKAENSLHTSAGYGTREEVLSAEVPGVRGEVQFSQVPEDDRRPGEDVVPE